MQYEYNTLPISPEETCNLCEGLTAKLNHVGKACYCYFAKYLGLFCLQYFGAYSETISCGEKIN